MGACYERTLALLKICPKVAFALIENVIDLGYDYRLFCLYSSIFSGPFLCLFLQNVLLMIANKV